MELTVKNKAGKDTKKKIDLLDSIYGIEPNDHAIYLDVKQYMANKRQGTHKAKEKGEVSFSTRKIKKQKGTGGARAGSLKSPIFVGGGAVFGPKPHGYGFKLNKKLKQLARKSALSYKAKEKNITVLEDIEFKAPKTKEFAEIIGNLGLTDKNTLFVLPESNKNVYLSSRNFQGADILIASNLNTYQVMRAQNIVFLESAVKKIESQLTK